MMVDLYRSFADALTDKTMFDWHRMLLSGDTSIQVIGGYRTHADAMQVVSGPIHKRTVHFEAPPSSHVPAEMKQFITWFNVRELFSELSSEPGIFTDGVCEDEPAEACTGDSRRA